MHNSLINTNTNVKLNIVNEKDITSFKYHRRAIIQNH